MTRLYLNNTLHAKQELTLDPDQSHYLAKVLRYQIDDMIKIFNEKDGEWTAQITEITKKSVSIKIDEQFSVARPCPPLWLAFSPLKHEAMGFLIEKATELGVTQLQPLITDRCNNHRLNLERLQKNAIEAAQQCERHDIPRVLEPLAFGKFLNALPPILWFAPLERSESESIKQTLEKANHKLPWGFIIGPEGGFSVNEARSIKNHSSVKPIHLGPLILRAETAALSALAIAQSCR
ncbi:MAG: 16S rRNA (uracil(1498)-N(3))-methyltransferase [Alphaproteobacteria bacterium]|jgi:16S rRNA (uracil1498-N3)-methyltransferase|nr:16S rRNA (uracil(1498)-N(3))-methyltransferase [Alphaproteobacteria bacterium]